MFQSQTKPGLATLPIFGPVLAGSICACGLTCFHGTLWDGRYHPARATPPISLRFHDPFGPSSVQATARDRRHAAPETCACRSPALL